MRAVLDSLIPKSRLEKGLYWSRAWRLVEGCTKVSAGCDNCWAEQQAHMRSRNPNPSVAESYADVTNDCGGWNGNTRFLKENLDIPLNVKKPQIFAIWNDLFHEDVSNENLVSVLNRISLAKRHIYLALTKRPHLALERLENTWELGGPYVPENLWIGTTVESNYQEDRIWDLEKIPARYKFVSMEPCLSTWTLTREIADVFDWFIIGAESGSSRRHCPPEVMAFTVEQVRGFGKPVFVKQAHIGGKVSKNPSEWPAGLRYREFPFNAPTLEWTCI